MKKNVNKLLAFAAAGTLAFAAVAPVVAAATPVKADVSSEEYRVFVAFGGDAAEENDWGLSYAGGDASEGITVTDGTITSGGTTTVSLEFANPVVNAWYFAPTMIAEDVSAASFDVQVFIDGEEVAVDMAAGDNWWYEGTGDFSDKEAIRIAGGFNEWGAQYIAEPAGFTKIEYTITANKIMIGTPAEEEDVVGAPIDLDGVYHAYIGFQTPTYSFRNAWSEPNYGFGKPEFDQVTGWDADNNEIVKAGSFTDVEIAGNGTYTVSVNGLDCADDFSAQDYMNLIFVSTDIPYTTDITFSDIKLNVNGSEQSISNFVVPDTEAYLTAQLQNIWDTENGIAEIGYYPTPVTDMSITFTVSGFNYDNTSAVVEEVVEDTTEEVVEEAPVVAEPAQAGLPVGAIVGIVIGSVVIVAGVVVAIILVNKKKKANK